MEKNRNDHHSYTYYCNNLVQTLLNLKKDSYVYLKSLLIFT